MQQIKHIDMKRLTEAQLRKAISEAVEYNMAGGPVGTSDNFWGCPKITIRWHGEWSDPEVLFNGYTANYYDIEEAVCDWAKEDGIDYKNDDEFAQYCQEHEDEICDMIIECGEKEENPFEEIDESKEAKQTVTLNENTLRNIVKGAVKTYLKEGSTDQEVYNKWLDAMERLGAEHMLDEIWNYLNCDQLKNIVTWLNQDYELWPDD